MTHSQRRRLALRMLDFLDSNRRCHPVRELADCLNQLELRWQALRHDLRLGLSAADRGWRVAARMRIGQTRFDRESFECDWKELCRTAHSIVDPPAHHCTVTTLMADLAELEESFPGVAARENTLRVQTDPVTLEDIDLGPFEIRIDLTRLGTMRAPEAIRITALDPHPAARRREVVHPHVEAGILCMGDGAAAIYRALADGRILDCIHLVHAVLTTYNPDSPYVRLDHWEDLLAECCDCGDEVPEDRVWSCDTCIESFCEGCILTCDACQGSVCRGCSGDCPTCDERRCSACLDRCRSCDAACCRKCVNQEGFCSSCVEERARKGSEDVESNTQTTRTGTAANGEARREQRPEADESCVASVSPVSEGPGSHGHDLRAGDCITGGAGQWDALVPAG